MSGKLKFGLIGAGGIAQAYAQAFATSQVAELVALGATAALVLTRSLYHLAILVPAIGAAAVLARDRRTVLAFGLAVSLLPAGWYAKNLAQSGFFGASSIERLAVEPAIEAQARQFKNLTSKGTQP